MNDNVIDLALRKAERQAETLEPIPNELDDDVMIECAECQNKAFAIVTTRRADASFVGHDLICTACDWVVDLSEGLTRE